MKRLLKALGVTTVVVLIVLLFLSEDPRAAFSAYGLSGVLVLISLIGSVTTSRKEDQKAARHDARTDETESHDDAKH